MFIVLEIERSSPGGRVGTKNLWLEAQAVTRKPARARLGLRLWPHSRPRQGTNSSNPKGPNHHTGLAYDFF